MTKHWCENLDELIDFIALVVLHAPEEFPKEDWLKPGTDWIVPPSRSAVRR